MYILFNVKANESHDQLQCEITITTKKSSNQLIHIWTLHELYSQITFVSFLRSFYKMRGSWSFVFRQLCATSLCVCVFFHLSSLLFVWIINKRILQKSLAMEKETVASMDEFLSISFFCLFFLFCSSIPLQNKWRNNNAAKRKLLSHWICNKYSIVGFSFLCSTFK